MSDPSRKRTTRAPSALWWVGAAVLALVLVVLFVGHRRSAPAEEGTVTLSDVTHGAAGAGASAGAASPAAALPAQSTAAALGASGGGAPASGTAGSPPASGAAGAGAR